MFICGGTFVGVTDIIRRRIGQSAIGFSNEGNRRDMIREEGEVLSQVVPEDLVEFGMIPELVGRLPVVTTLDPLDVDMLVQILTEPRNALVKQYQKFFEYEQCQLEFTSEALRLLAQNALERETGARGLRGVMEELMLESMYELPEHNQSGKKVVNEAVVEGKKPLLAPKTRRRRESA